MTRQRRGRSEGSIFQRGDGQWTASINLGLDGNGKRRRRVIYGKSKSDVAKKLRGLQTQADSGRIPEISALTTAQWLARWLDAVKGQIAPYTLAGYQSCTNRYLQPHLGGVKLTALSALHVEKLYADLGASGVSPAMQKKAGITLGVALQAAVKRHLIPYNVSRDVKKPKHTPEEMQALDPDQAQRFLAAAKQDRLYALYVLAIDSAARQGELFALSWADVDFQGSAITITKNLQEIRGLLELKDVKTKKSRRRVALSGFTMEALAEHRKAMLAEGNCGPDKPVFCDHQGGWLRKSNVLRRSFQPIIGRANDAALKHAQETGHEPALLPQFRPYDLRHTGATLLLLADESPKVVSERLGHSKTTQTMDTYSHVLPGMQERAAAKMEAIFRQPSASAKRAT